MSSTGAGGARPQRKDRPVHAVVCAGPPDTGVTLRLLPCGEQVSQTDTVSRLIPASTGVTLRLSPFGGPVSQTDTVLRVTTANTGVTLRLPPCGRQVSQTDAVLHTRCAQPRGAR